MPERLFFTASAAFEAARRIPTLAEGHRARRLHGHGFIARIRAELPQGWAPFDGGETEALHGALAAAIEPFDYADLNELLSVPSDENLARWLRGRLARLLPEPCIGAVGIAATADRGADIDAADHAHSWHRFRFEAAHRLPHVPEGHQCGRMHGHGFEVIVHVDQSLAGADMGIDFDRMAAHWAPLQRELHHACLNDIPGLENPTSELLCRWLWQKLKPDLPALSWITVYETATAGCHFDGANYRIWKELRFESALRLRSAPQGDGRRRLHGHSYLLRLHLTAPLDTVLGWTVDYGDVKALFAPIYAELDHHRLDRLQSLEDPDPGRIARWIRERATGQLPALDRIDVQQTPGCGAVLHWGALGPALPG
jgi:6-pyruvoyltetrahydropterin/6-carboxytetrahydropterin synthase